MKKKILFSLIVLIAAAILSLIIYISYNGIPTSWYATMYWSRIDYYYPNGERIGFSAPIGKTEITLKNDLMIESKDFSKKYIKFSKKIVPLASITQANIDNFCEEFGLNNKYHREGSGRYLLEYGNNYDAPRGYSFNFDYENGKLAYFSYHVNIENIHDTKPKYVPSIIIDNVEVKLPIELSEIEKLFGKNYKKDRTYKFP